MPSRTDPGGPGNARASIFRGALAAEVDEESVLPKKLDDSILYEIRNLTAESRANGNRPCYGEIEFPEGRHRNSMKRLEGRAKFAVIPKHANARDVLRLLENSWGISRPGALFSVAGGVMNLKLHTVLAQILTRGLAEAAQISEALITTAGIDAGVMRLIGVGLQKANSTAPLVGIAPWSVLDETTRAELRQASDDEMPSMMQHSADKLTLEPHHTHFLLINEPHGGRRSRAEELGAALGEENNLLSDMEQRLQQHSSVPRLLLAVQGERSTLDSIVQAVT